MTPEELDLGLSQLETNQKKRHAMELERMQKLERYVHRQAVLTVIVSAVLMLEMVGIAFVMWLWHKAHR